MHVEDISRLFLTLLRRSLIDPAPSGKAGGYYFAESGFVSWKTLAEIVGRYMHRRGFTDTPTAQPFASNIDAAPLLNCSPGYVSHIFGGLVRLRAERGATIGWVPQHGGRHLEETFDEEIDHLEAQGFAFEAKKILKHDELHGE